MHYLAPTERFLRRTVLSMLLVVALSALLAFVLHALQTDRRPLDLILPPLLALIMLGSFVWLYRQPQSLLPVIWVATLCAVAGLAIPAWYYTVAAWPAAQGTLVGSLPPITSLLVPVLLVVIVFLRPRRLLAVATGIWLIVATPILVYLAAHPDELATPRGLDMVLALGPVTLLMVIFIPYQHGIEHWISRLQHERAQAQSFAERDTLTGLYNRRAAERFLADLLDAPDHNDTLILFDIDRFKSINDTHGHPAGDAVLRAVAQRCAALLRKSDVFARWGGEEFLVLARGADEAGMMGVADALCTAISAEPIGAVGTVTASFGVAPLFAADTADSWVKRADEALYEAKTTGRNRVVGRRRNRQTG